jgi:hypothetical protein
MSHKTNDDVFINYKRIWDEQITNLNLPNFNFKFLYSDNNISDEYVVQGNNLITNCVEDYWVALILKVINGFDYFIQNDFDLVFKTNLSTIINFEKFYEYCEQISKSREFIYDGIVGNYQDYFFCSGAGMLLNKPSVNLILNNKWRLDDTWTDDIFIGFILNKLNGIKPNEGNISRLDIINKNTKFTREDIINNTHIRVKVREHNLDIEYSNLVNKYLIGE